VVDRALQRDWPVEQLLTRATSHPIDHEDQALVWRISLLTDPAPDEIRGVQIQATRQPRAAQTSTERTFSLLRSVADSEHRWVEADLALISPAFSGQL
jgi:hypothetical protein